MEKGKIDLINGPIGPTLRKFTLPLAISFVVHMLYAWVDMWYVSMIGPDEVAAVGVSEQILFFIASLGIGIGIGTGVIVARRTGENDKKMANITGTQAIIVMFFVAILMALLLIFSLDFILGLMNISEKIAEITRTYINIVFVAMPFNFIIFQVNAIIRAMGNSRLPMVILIVSNLINAAVAPILIFVLDMGIFGAGLATAIAQLIMSIVAVTIVSRGRTGFTWGMGKKIIDFKLIKKIFGIGFPASVQMLVISTNRIILSSFAAGFSDAVLTTYMIGLRVDLFVFMPILAVGAAIETITGQNLGAGRQDRVFRFHKSALSQLAVLMLAFGTIVFFFGRWVVMIFTSEPALLDSIEVYLRIAAFSYVFFSTGMVTVRVISGAGDYYRSLRIITMILVVIQVPLCKILSMQSGIGYEGIWYGIFASQLVFAAIALWSFRKKKWLLAKV